MALDPETMPHFRYVLEDGLATVIVGPVSRKLLSSAK